MSKYERAPVPSVSIVGLVLGEAGAAIYEITTVKTALSGVMEAAYGDRCWHTVPPVVARIVAAAAAELEVMAQMGMYTVITSALHYYISVNKNDYYY